MSLPGALLPWAELSFVLTDGTPNVNGKLYFYDAGTSTPAAVYQDADLTVPHSQPILLDAYGFPPAMIFLAPQAYRLVEVDEDDVAVRTRDNVSDPAYTFFALLGQYWSVGSKNVESGYEITEDDTLVTVDEPSIDPAVITLLEAADQKGVLIIQNRCASAVAITPVVGETINGDSGPYTLPAASSGVSPTAILISDGISDYTVIAESQATGASSGNTGGGTLLEGSPDTATTNTSQATLLTLAIPANTLVADGDRLMGRIVGSFGAGAAVRRVIVEWGATVIADIGTGYTPPGSPFGWYVDFMITRRGAAIQGAAGIIQPAPVGQETIWAQAAETLSGIVNITVKAQAADGAGGATLRDYWVGYFPA